MKKLILALTLLSLTAVAEEKASPELVTAEVSASKPLLITCRNEKNEVSQTKTTRYARYAAGYLLAIEPQGDGTEYATVMKGNCIVEPNYIVKIQSGSDSTAQ